MPQFLITKHNRMLLLTLKLALLALMSLVALLLLDAPMAHAYSKADPSTATGRAVMTSHPDDGSYIDMTKNTTGRNLFANGQAAYCLHPGMSGPGNGGSWPARSIRASDFPSELMYRGAIAALYYAPGGPGAAKGREIFPSSVPDFDINDMRIRFYYHWLMAYFYQGNLAEFGLVPAGSYPSQHSDGYGWGEDRVLENYLKSQIVPASDSDVANTNRLSGRVLALANDRDMVANGGYTFDDFASKVILIMRERTNTGYSLQDIMSWDGTPPSKVSISLTKSSSNQGLSKDNSCYSLAGAKYGVFASKPDADTANEAKAILVLTTDAAGNAQSDEIFAPGDYWIRELKASSGYALDTKSHKVSAVAGEGGRVAVSEAPQHAPVSVLVQKKDADMDKATPQGQATLAGAEFTVRYYDGMYSKSNLPSRATKTWVIKTNAEGKALMIEAAKVSGDEFYKNSAGKAIIPIGTVTVAESKAPAGYKKSNEVKLVQIKSDGSASEAIPFPNEAEPYPNQIIRGGVSMGKTDRDLARNTAQGKATLAGAQFAVISDNDNPVVVDGETYGKGDTVLVLTTGANGRAQSAEDALPYGNYIIREASAPKGYNINEGWTAKVQIREQDAIIDTGTCDDPVVRGNITTPKIDRELAEALPLGGATLEGAVFEVRSENEQPVVVNKATFTTGQVVATIVSGADGKAIARSLPYGDYSVREVKAPEGYLLNDTWSASVQVREEGATVEAPPVDDQVKRGDIRFNKVDGKSMERLANVAFRITSETTGESHVLVTDSNGMASTAASWNPHTQRTNANDAVDLNDGSAETDKTDADAGIWFDGRIDRKTEVADKLGALPYDTYTIEELRGDTNIDYNMISFRFKVSRNAVELDMGSLDDPTLTLETELVEAKGESHYAPATGTVQLTDFVHYEGLDAGAEYTVEGRLVDKASGATIVSNGEEVTASKRFKPKASSGAVEVQFELDATDIAGKSAVAFERLLEADGTTAAVHEDPDDADQTILTPTIATELASSDGSKEGAVASSETILVDRVDYTGLEPGIEHVAKGALHLRGEDGTDRGPVVDAEGKPIVAETSFTPEASSGSEAVEFRFDATLLESSEVVAFQEIWRDDTLWAVHADISDSSQAIALKEPPSLEKYIERDVHAVLEDAEKEFSYDVMAYVTADAEAITVYDELVSGLTFSHGAEDVRIFDMGEDNNHKVAGVYSTKDHADDASIAAEGVDITEQATVSLEDYMLTAKIEGVADKGLREHWVRITFRAKVSSNTPWQRIEENGSVLSSESHEGIPNTARYVVDAKDAPGRYEIPSNTVTVETPQEPAIEKYVNRDVHQDLANFEEVFTYDVLAYITQDAVATTITDELVGEVEFACNPDAVRITDMGAFNNHLPYGTYSDEDRSDDAAVSGNGTDITASCQVLIEGKRLSVIIEDARALRGRWVRVTFDAKLLGLSGIKRIEHNNPVVSSKAHEGIPNGASYTIDTNDRQSAYSLESNIVTVIPPAEPAIEKYVNRDVHQDLANNGEEFTYDVMAFVTPDATAATITDELVSNLAFACEPKDVRIADMGTENNHRVSGAYSQKDRTDDATVGAEGKNISDACKTSIEANKLTVRIEDAKALRGHWVRVTFRAQSLSTADYQAITENVPVRSSEPHEGIPNKASYCIDTADKPSAYNQESNTVTVTTPDEPAIEKYVGKDVHQDLGSREEVFTYEVMAYVTGKADAVTITDELVPTLAFADDAGAVKIEDLGFDNNHKVNGAYSTEERSDDATVASKGDDIKGACKVSVEGQKLLVEIPDAKAYRGHWVRVAFNATARVTDGYETIRENGSVLSKLAHVGIPNKASYEIRSGDSPAIAAESNTVTVRPPEEPAIEKYVSKDVHQDLKSLSDTFVYDVMAYVPKDAIAITVSDELASEIEFACKPDEVKVAGPLGDNHRTNGAFSKASKDASVTSDANDITKHASVSIEGKKLTVSLAGTDGLELNGAWVRISFAAKASSHAHMVEISDNGTVASDRSHIGLPNCASYTADAKDRPGAYAGKSNTVTVAPPNTPQPDKKANHGPEPTPSQKNPVGSFFAKAGNLLAQYGLLFALIAIGVFASGGYLFVRSLIARRDTSW